MSFDYSKLRGKIREKFGTQENFALAIGISRASLSDKLNEKSDFSHSEIISICDKLDISVDSISDYFFTKKLKQT